MTSRLLPALLALALAAPVGAETLTGKVVALSDGDTLTVLVGTTQHKIRLHAIDAPETGQAYGTQAKQFSSAKVFGQTVTVDVRETDRYGRKVGVVQLPGGTTLNLELVKSGMAWWYHQYGKSDRAIAEAEIDARAARRGLWADANPQPPWAFRHPAPGGRSSLPRPRAIPVLKPASAPRPPVAPGSHRWHCLYHAVRPQVPSGRL